MVTSRLFSAKDLWNLHSSRRFELIEGELHEVSPAGQRSSEISGNIFFLVKEYLKSNPVGIATPPDGGYVVLKDPDTVLAPDVGFVRTERQPGGRASEGFVATAPDFAVEVVSPSDKRTEIDRKQALYERAGVPIVWWVYPEEQTVKVCFRGHDPKLCGVDTVLSGYDVLPGFELPVSGIFKS